MGTLVAMVNATVKTTAMISVVMAQNFSGRNMANSK
jgi:hypothetical protein